MYHRTVCKNPTLVLQDKDIQEAQQILKEMIKPGASKKYIHYQRYKEALDQCIHQLHELKHIQHYEAT